VSAQLSRVWNEAGSYYYLPGVRPFSAGVVAGPGHEIVRVSMNTPARELGPAVESVVGRGYGRPLSALCAVELRSPAPMSWDAFHAFNDDYAATLDELGVTLDGGANPVARTNVVPHLDPPAELTIRALAFTVPARDDRTSFVVAGAAEVAGNDAEDVLLPGDTTDAAFREKVNFVVERMKARVEALEVAHDERAVARVYTARVLDSGSCELIGRGVGDREGSFALHVARPPIEGLEFEMDVRCVAREEIA
jgi:hypothetical protein